MLRGRATELQHENAALQRSLRAAQVLESLLALLAQKYLLYWYKSTAKQRSLRVAQVLLKFTSCFTASSLQAALLVQKYKS